MTQYSELIINLLKEVEEEGKRMSPFAGFTTNLLNEVKATIGMSETQMAELHAKARELCLQLEGLHRAKKHLEKALEYGDIIEDDPNYIKMRKVVDIDTDVVFGGRSDNTTRK